MKIQESGEMYLETIFRLSLENSTVRSIDISEAMGFSKPSVSRAVSLLKEGGYIEMDEDKHIKLTADGYDIAYKIYERHVVLTFLLKDLGVNEETAAADACRMEHVVSDESFDAIKKHIRKDHADIIDDMKMHKPE